MLLCSLFEEECFSQGLNTWSVQPTTPTASDTLTSVAYLYFLFNPCTADSSTVRDSLNYIIIDTWHCIPPNSGTCLVYDTVKIMPHPAGQYYLILNEWADTGACSTGTYINYGASAIIQIGPSGVNELNPCRHDIYYDSHSQSVRIKQAAGCSSPIKYIFIYDVRGQLVWNTVFSADAEFIPFDHSEGIYFYRCVSRTDNSVFGKFALMK
jgi:hypothetical protein